MSKYTRNMKNVIAKNNKDNYYYDTRGDNYLYKNDWVHRTGFRPSPNSKWRDSHRWWVKSKNLNLHDGFNSNTNLNYYEAKVDPRYFRKYKSQLYKYDNPIFKSEKYNDVDFEATTRGYSKMRNRSTTSIQRKRNTVIS